MAGDLETGWNSGVISYKVDVWPSAIFSAVVTGQRKSGMDIRTKGTNAV